MEGIRDTEENKYGGHWIYWGNSIWLAFEKQVKINMKVLEILKKFNMDGIA